MSIGGPTNPNSSSSSSSLFSLELFVHSFTKTSNCLATFVPQIDLKVLDFPRISLCCVDDDLLRLLRRGVDAEVLAFAHDVDLFRHNVDEAVRDTLVKFDVLNPDDPSASVRYIFSRGKSLLFESHLESLVDALSSAPLVVVVKEALPDDARRRSLLGTGILRLDDVVGELKKEIDGAGDEALAASRGVEADCQVVDPMGGVVGVVRLDAKIVFYGKAGRLLLEHVNNNNEREKDGDVFGEKGIDSAETKRGSSRESSARREKENPLSRSDQDRRGENLVSSSIKKTTKVKIEEKQKIEDRRDAGVQTAPSTERPTKLASDRRRDFAHGNSTNRATCRGVQTELDRRLPTVSYPFAPITMAAVRPEVDFDEPLHLVNPPVLYYNSQNDAFHSSPRRVVSDERRVIDRRSLEGGDAVVEKKRDALSLPPAELVLESLRKPKNFPVLQSLLRELLRFIDAETSPQNPMKNRVKSRSRAVAAEINDAATQTESRKGGERSESRPVERGAGDAGDIGGAGDAVDVALTPESGRLEPPSKKDAAPSDFAAKSFKRQCSKLDDPRDGARGRPLPKAKSYIRSTPSFRSKVAAPSRSAGSTNTHKLRMAKHNPGAVDADDIVEKRGVMHVRLRRMPSQPLVTPEPPFEQMLPEKQSPFLYTGSSKDSLRLSAHRFQDRPPSDTAVWPPSRPGWTSDEEWAAPTRRSVSVASSSSPSPDRRRVSMSFLRRRSMRASIEEDEAEFVEKAPPQPSASVSAPIAAVRTASSPSPTRDSWTGIVPNLRQSTPVDAASSRSASPAGKKKHNVLARLGDKGKTESSDFKSRDSKENLKDEENSRKKERRDGRENKESSREDDGKKMEKSKIEERKTREKKEEMERKKNERGSTKSSPSSSSSSSIAKSKTISEDSKRSKSSKVSSATSKRSALETPALPDRLKVPSRENSKKDSKESSASSADGTSYPTVKKSPGVRLPISGLTAGTSVQPTSISPEKVDVGEKDAATRRKSSTRKSDDDVSDSYSMDFSSHDDAADSENGGTADNKVRPAADNKGSVLDDAEKVGDKSVDSEMSADSISSKSTAPGKVSPAPRTTPLSIPVPQPSTRSPVMKRQSSNESSGSKSTPKNDAVLPAVAPLPPLNLSLKKSLPPRQFSSSPSSSPTPRQQRTPAPSSGRAPSRNVETPTTSWEPSDVDNMSSGGSEFERDVAKELGLSKELGSSKELGASRNLGMSRLRLSTAKPAENAKLGYTY